MRISDWSSDVCSSDLNRSPTPSLHPPCYRNRPREDKRPPGCQSACPSSVSLKNPDQEAPMWLIPRNTDGTPAGRIALPAPVREALGRGYVGQCSRAGEVEAIMIVNQAQTAERGLDGERCACERPPP